MFNIKPKGKIRTSLDGENWSEWMELFVKDTLTKIDTIDKVRCGKTERMLIPARGNAKSVMQIAEGFGVDISEFI